VTVTPKHRQPKPLNGARARESVGGGGPEPVCGAFVQRSRSCPWWRPPSFSDAPQRRCGPSCGATSKPTAPWTWAAASSPLGWGRDNGGSGFPWSSGPIEPAGVVLGPTLMPPLTARRRVGLEGQWRVRLCHRGSEAFRPLQHDVDSPRPRRSVGAARGAGGLGTHATSGCSPEADHEWKADVGSSGVSAGLRRRAAVEGDRVVPCLGSRVIDCSGEHYG